MHITNFNERFNGRLHYNTGRRLNNGFIRNGHNVLTISDRDILHNNKSLKDFKGQTPYSIGRRNKLVETCKLLKSELSCEDIDDSVDDPLETLRDAINKVNAGELSIDDLGLNMAQFQEAKRLVNSHR